MRYDVSGIDSRNQPDGINWNSTSMRSMSLFMSDMQRAE